MRGKKGHERKKRSLLQVLYLFNYFHPLLLCSVEILQNQSHSSLLCVLGLAAVLFRPLLCAIFHIASFSFSLLVFIPHDLFSRPCSFLILYRTVNTTTSSQLPPLYYINFVLRNCCIILGPILPYFTLHSFYALNFKSLQSTPFTVHKCPGLANKVKS